MKMRKVDEVLKVHEYIREDLANRVVKGGGYDRDHAYRMVQHDSTMLTSALFSGAFATEPAMTEDEETAAYSELQDENLRLQAKLEQSIMLIEDQIALSTTTSGQTRLALNRLKGIPDPPMGKTVTGLEPPT